MAKQSNQKLKLLYLVKILFEKTNEQTGLTITQLSAELAKYNISAARKSLYDDIEALRLFGMAIGVRRDRYVKYYIAKRDISAVELQFLIDALNEFEALSPSASYELVEKLFKLYGVKNHTCMEQIIEPIYKTPKMVYDELSKNIELLDNAISQGKKILCKQFVWNSQKQRTLVNGGEYLKLTPIRLICDGKYFLYAYDGKNVSMYNVVSLIDIDVLAEKAATADEYRELLADPKYDAEYDNVRLECNNAFAGEVFLKFGLGVTILSNKEDCFEISVKVKLDGNFFAWIFNNAKHVRIISPERVRNMYKDKLLLAWDNTEDPRF